MMLNFEVTILNFTVNSDKTHRRGLNFNFYSLLIHKKNIIINLWEERTHSHPKCAYTCNDRNRTRMRMGKAIRNPVDGHKWTFTMAAISSRKKNFISSTHWVSLLRMCIFALYINNSWSQSMRKKVTFYIGTSNKHTKKKRVKAANFSFLLKFKNN